MTHLRRFCFLVLGAMLLPACSSPLTSPGPAPAGNSADVSAAMTACVDEVNRYRAVAGLSALTRSAALDSYATESAQVDAKGTHPHEHFLATNGGGIAFAETELLAWKSGSVHTIIQQGFAQMWKEGPAGEHYQIIVGPYTEIGCGMSIDANGVTLAQDFR